MRAVTWFRGTSWVGAAIGLWSLNVRWGTDVMVGNGPPRQFERLVVGAALLVVLVAVTVSVSGRDGRAPKLRSKLVALAGALGALGLAWLVRSRAHANGFPDLVAGAGWTWMLAGGGFALSAAIGWFGLKPPDGGESTPSTSGRSAGSRGRKGKGNKPRATRPTRSS